MFALEILKEKKKGVPRQSVDFNLNKYLINLWKLIIYAIK